MNYKVEIRNNQTGEVRVAPQDTEWHEDLIFWWRDGNMGCDCSRGLVFMRAGGVE